MPHVTYAPAGEKDLPRLREIFLRCFGEEAAPEMEYVFARCGDALWKAERDGIPAAMLVAMPVTIALPEGEWKARYFYGVATHPDYRKQGLCGGLLAACCRWMAEQGEAAALLRPDSEKNRQFYRKNGFADCSTVGVGQFTAGGGETLPCAPAEPERYDAIRRKMAPWGLHWGKEGLATQKGWMKLYGGDLWLLGAPEQPVGSAAVSREGETPLVRELLCPEALRAQALESLCKALESRELRLALPGAEPADGLRTEPMMMARETAEIGLPGEIYTPLAMD